MSQLVGKHVSPRHGFAFDHVPTRRGSVHGGSCVVHYPDSYGAILDCVYEMACDIADGNGTDAPSAVAQACTDEGWTLLPRHREIVIAKIEARA